MELDDYLAKKSKVDHLLLRLEQPDLKDDLLFQMVIDTAVDERIMSPSHISMYLNIASVLPETVLLWMRGEQLPEDYETRSKVFKLFKDTLNIVQNDTA